MAPALPDFSNFLAKYHPRSYMSIEHSVQRLLTDGFNWSTSIQDNAHKRLQDVQHGEETSSKDKDRGNNATLL